MKVELLGDHIELVDSSIDFAKELAVTAELYEAPDEETLRQTVRVMNHHLFGVGQNEHSIIKSGLALIATLDEADVEFMNDREVDQGLVRDVLVRGKIDSFSWFGSLPLSGFGVVMYGVEFIKPERHHADTVFLPVEAIDLRLCA